MTSTTEPRTEIPAIKAVIHQFLQERLQPKLDKLKEGDDEKRQKLLQAYQAETWIADAAHRVSQIQQVTHAIKYTHPDAKGASLNSAGNKAAGEAFIGTHTLNGSAIPDVVGNAAALDVYKFLRLEVNGKRLLTLASEKDPAMAAAFSDDPKLAQTLMAAFAGISQAKGQPASHKLAKQVYWPLNNSDYHLLAPLFPTSLAHEVYQGIREDRFSDAAKAARTARYDKQPHEQGFREYPNFAIQNFGGTKPQNISQLNSERHGENYLLASVPPTWKSEPISPPLKVKSIFERWLDRRKDIYRLNANFRRYLVRVEQRNNLDIRNKRAELALNIRDEVMQIAAHLQGLRPGWSAHEDCRLNPAERFWLDPWRVLDDETFAAERARSEWQDAICERFAHWLNARLSSDKTPMSQPEHNEWSHLLKKELRMLREELDIHD
jgi:CRISPR-associated protein Csy1